MADWYEVVRISIWRHQATDEHHAEESVKELGADAEPDFEWWQTRHIDDEGEGE